MRTTVSFSALDTALTVWWEQPEDAPKDAVYTVLLDGKPFAECYRTHETLGQLQPGTRYDVQICLRGELIGEITAQTAAPREPIDVNKAPYCAVGDGQTMNTKALQAAIDDCGPGQEVYFPAGVYRTGALRLHSDMAIHLAKDAVLQGTDHPMDYLPKIESRFEGVHQQCYQSLLNLGELHADAGPNCRNVLIYGEGTICGGGQPLALNVIEREKELLKDQLAALGDKIKEYENDHTIPGRARGRLINLSNCENVRITGLTLQNGASWNVHMVYSRNIVTDHCVFRSEDVWNGDGWDPDSSEDCTLFASEFHTGDDSVAIKSGKNPEGNRVNRPTRRIRIFDCVSEYGLGIAIGSEMSGGVEDVKIWDCDLRHSLYGVQIKATKKRGGYVRNISVRDCALSRFLVTAVLYNDDGEGAKEPPVFERFRCDRVFFTGWARDYWEKEDHAVPAIQLSGFPVPGHEVRDAVFRQCASAGEAEIRLQDCRNVSVEIDRAEAKQA
ncbi:MAG: glycoside hydrolase family 28 protein [Clostridia bacterium]|nr:glycoside hydrolase family 28 protein [Clostridia bacterium]MBR0408858.1 glycoside hydrolase family 28 protein [Clostridia bacterium]